MIASVFSMQGIGSATAAITGMVLLRLSTNLDLVWRLSLGLGAVPGILSMYFRIKMEETSLFAEQRAREEDKIPMWRRYRDAVKIYWKELLGAAGGWFLLDVVFYSNGLFSSALLDVFEVESEKALTPHEELIRVATFTVYLALMAVPGYWLAVYLVEVKGFGRRNTQLLGFGTLALNYLVIAIGYKDLEDIPWLFMLLYGLTFFLINAGANTTTFILPSELFPTRFRATLHGICAASGKLGAIVGAYSMAFLVEKPDLVFYTCSVIAFLGMVLTFFTIPETRKRDLAELDREDEVRTAIYSPASTSEA
eukprot:TRINITY_DN2674_c0_g1_i1.p1 TRINITY_DN2674_c0_g1~~TRINITY_DN2674_c0_g1_i1.p1  ORF type:complete len:309 (+),score=59.62 TRINITY_DN2674_c0_g1_i1:696-1622(+)